MKRIILILILMLNLSVHASTITIGVMNYAPPFSYPLDNGNHFYGFSIDLMDAICKLIHQECLYKGVHLGDEINELNSGIIDVSFSPNPISLNPPNHLIYSLPYLSSNLQFITYNGSQIKSIEQLINKKIGVLQDTLLQHLLNSKYGLKNTIIRYDTLANMIVALTDKKVDAILVNETVAKYFVQNSSSQLKLIGNVIRLGYGYGILALKSNEKLISEINNALIELESDGTYLKIYNKYFGI